MACFSSVQTKEAVTAAIKLNESNLLNRVVRVSKAVRKVRWPKLVTWLQLSFLKKHPINVLAI